MDPSWKTIFLKKWVVGQFKFSLSLTWILWKFPRKICYAQRRFHGEFVFCSRYRFSMHREVYDIHQISPNIRWNSRIWSLCNSSDRKAFEWPTHGPAPLEPCVQEQVANECVHSILGFRSGEKDQLMLRVQMLAF